MTDYEKEFQKNPAACGEPFKEFEAFFQKLDEKPISVLDLGCGQGRDALMIARLGHSVHGVDLSPTGIRQMLQASEGEGLNITGEVADIVHFSPSKAFDIVLLDRVLHMLAADEDRISVLTNVITLIRKGGYILLADTPKNLPKIEDFFSGKTNWEQVYKKKGFRFYLRT